MDSLFLLEPCLVPAPVHLIHRSYSTYSSPLLTQPQRYDPTIEDSYSVTRHVDGLPYFLSLTDTAGQEEYRGLWAASNLSSDAFLLVYDITQASSLDNLTYFLDMIDIEAEHRHEENVRTLKEYRAKGRTPPEGALRAMPVKIVAGNKCDLKDARVVSSRQGLEWARARGCGFMETSAREMVNIEETFACLSPSFNPPFHITLTMATVIVRRVVEARRPPSNGLSRPIGLSIPPPAASRPGAGQSQSPISPSHAQNMGSGYTATMPLQMQARQMRNSPPPPMDVEKSGFDHDDAGGGS